LGKTGNEFGQQTLFSQTMFLCRDYATYFSHYFGNLIGGIAGTQGSCHLKKSAHGNHPSLGRIICCKVKKNELHCKWASQVAKWEVA
jgi:hypothetical protein